MKRWIIEENPTGDFLLSMEVARKMSGSQLYFCIDIDSLNDKCVLIDTHNKYASLFFKRFSKRKIARKLIHGDEQVKRYMSSHILMAINNTISYWIPKNTGDPQ